MEKELGKFGAIAFAAAIALEGCSNVLVPTPNSSVNGSEKPNPTIAIDNIVNCQINPFDDGGKIYTLKKEEIVRVGGITKAGKEDAFSFRANGDGSFVFSPEDNSFIGRVEPGNLQVEDNKLIVIAEARLNGTITIIGVSVTCIDAVPKTPPVPQA